MLEAPETGMLGLSAMLEALETGMLDAPEPATLIAPGILKAASPEVLDVVCLSTSMGSSVSGCSPP